MKNFYSKNDKMYLYLIIDLFISDEIDEKTFCDEYYYSYNLEIDYSTLNENESLLFYELGKIASRFSEYPEDHLLDPKAFIDKSTLRQKVIEIKSELKSKKD